MNYSSYRPLIPSALKVKLDPQFQVLKELFITNSTICIFLRFPVKPRTRATANK
eukprot:UN25477